MVISLLDSGGPTLQVVHLLVDSFFEHPNQKQMVENIMTKKVIIKILFFITNFFELLPYSVLPVFRQSPYFMECAELLTNQELLLYEK